jgi:hypothetical protein
MGTGSTVGQGLADEGADLFEDHLCKSEGESGEREKVKVSERVRGSIGERR